MTLIHYVAAALVIIGSALVLRTVWLMDLDAPEAVKVPVPGEPAGSAEAEEWREAA